MELRKVKAYCQIIGCVNNLGTMNKNEVMFRQVTYMKMMKIFLLCYLTFKTKENNIELEGS